MYLFQNVGGRNEATVYIAGGFIVLGTALCVCVCDVLTVVTPTVVHAANRTALCVCDVLTVVTPTAVHAANRTALCV